MVCNAVWENEILPKLRRGYAGGERMAILIDIPQIAYRTWVIEIHTGDWMRDRELERGLSESMAMRKYPYSADHDHVR